MANGGNLDGYWKGLVVISGGWSPAAAWLEFEGEHIRGRFEALGQTGEQSRGEIIGSRHGDHISIRIHERFRFEGVIHALADPVPMISGTLRTVTSDLLMGSVTAFREPREFDSIIFDYGG